MKMPTAGIDTRKITLDAAVYGTESRFKIEPRPAGRQFAQVTKSYEMDFQQHWPIWLTLVGGLVAAAGAAAGAYISARNDARYQESLNEKNEEIIKLQNKLFGELTGGDSFVFARVGSGFIALSLEGGYPVYDLNMAWVDAEKPIADCSLQSIIKDRNEVDLGNVYPGRVATLPLPGNFLPLANEHKKFNFFFNARNGYWRQTIHLVHRDGEIISATQVTKGFSPQVKLHENVDERFPREVLDNDRTWLNDSRRLDKLDKKASPEGQP